MGQDRGRFAPDEAAIPWAVSGLGVFFLVAFFVEAAVFGGLRVDVFLSPALLAALAVMLPFVGGLVYGGYWLAKSEVSPERYPRAAKWCLGGSVAFFGLNAVLVAFFTPDTLWLTVGWLRGTATMGAAGGLLAGIIEARAIHNAVEAEREALRASYLENQREALDYLNGLLRHEVLNTAQVINGYTAVLLDGDLDEERRSQLEAIRRQSQDMTTVVEDIRLLIEALHDEAPLESVDLAAVLRDEVQDLRDAADAVDVDADVPDGVSVRADGLLPRVFANLLTNAVEHHDGEEPHVTVSVETKAERVVVRVADDGPGVPAEVRDDLFERTDRTHVDEGLGLYLVARLVDRYDGRVELTEAGPDGSTFTVELPSADPVGDEEAAVVPADAADGRVSSPDERRTEAGERTPPGAADAQPEGTGGG